MRIPLSWLRRHLETAWSLPKLARKLTDIGLEAETLPAAANVLCGFFVAQIREVTPHPDADRLRLCRVRGEGLQARVVVCGAPNARVGLKTVLGTAGAVVPATGAPLKKTVIRGVASDGMLCSSRELGLGEEASGIMELDADAACGTPLAEALGLHEEEILAIALTPDRGDCAGVRGVARDLAAAGAGRLLPVPPMTQEEMKGEFPCPFPLRIDSFADGAPSCLDFAGRLLRGVANRRSPPWLQQALISAGMKPVSALVDIANYIMLDQARPLHMFDAASLKGGLTMREAREGETLRALDGRSYALGPGMTVVADDEKALAVAGVLGSEDSACRLETRDVFIESALFAPARIAYAGRKLGIHSEARYRFERGVDAASTLAGLEAATLMVMELCGGAPSAVASAAPPGGKHVASGARRVAFGVGRVRSLGGVTVSEEESRRILEALGFTYDGKGVVAPSWRGDILCEADVVAEILRMKGLSCVAEEPLPAAQPATVAASPLAARLAMARRALAAGGSCETLGWSFMDSSHAALFGGGLPLFNPLSSELDVLRPSILPNLARAALRCLASGMKGAAMFECGPVWPEAPAHVQKTALAGVRAGVARLRHWRTGALREVDVFDAKDDALAALAAASVHGVTAKAMAAAPPWLHPRRAGILAAPGGERLGVFGMLHPSALRALGRDIGVEAGMAVFELDALSFPDPAPPAPFRPMPYPSLSRDFAFIVDADCPAAELMEAARAAAAGFAVGVDVFDLYQGRGVEEGRKSLGVTVTLQASDRTFEEKDIASLCAAIVEAVRRRCGGVLRHG